MFILTNMTNGLFYIVPSRVAAEVMLLWRYSTQDNWELQKEGLVRAASSSWLNLFDH